MRKHRLLALFSAVALASSMLFTACGSSDTTTVSNSSSDDNEEVVAEVEATDDTTDATAEETTASSTDYEQTYDFSLTAIEYVNNLTAGWNVGNSLDAYGSGSETAWGNPVITEELILAVKEAGFDVVRIPVTWYEHIADDENYTIDEEWLARVKEVVDYCIKNDMYAIINIHHDGNDTDIAWLECEPEDEDAMVDKFAKVWTQIAEYFADYGDHLMFAGMNEFHHGYNTPSTAYCDLTDRLNQTFVDTVRATGGYNASRYLIFQAYNTNITYGYNYLEIPEDTIEDHLIVEVHFYDPWNFAGSGNGDWGQYGTETDSWGQEDWVDEAFYMMWERFIDDANVPVIVGEYGCTKLSSDKSDYRRYYIEYVTKAMKEYGILPIIWDNGYDGTSGEGFALFSRVNYSVLHQDIVDAIMRACSGSDYEIEAVATGE